VAGVTLTGGKTYGDLDGSSSGFTASNRIVSGASTLEDEANSTGGEKILFAKEVATGTFCTNLFAHLCNSVWSDGIVLDWVERQGETTLRWAET
jgi:hypothetical protein